MCVDVGDGSTTKDREAYQWVECLLETFQHLPATQQVNGMLAKEGGECDDEESAVLEHGMH